MVIQGFILYRYVVQRNEMELNGIQHNRIPCTLFKVIAAIRFQTLCLLMEITKFKAKATQSSMFASITQLTHFLRVMIALKRPNNTNRTRNQRN